MIIRLWKNIKYQMKHNEILQFCLHWNTLSNLLFHAVSLLIFLKDLLYRKLQNQQFMSLQTLQSKLMLTLSHLSSEMERKTKCIFHSVLENLLSVHTLSSSSRWYKMEQMKIGKQPFYIFYIKFMMWLDYASSKFPIPWLREGEKGGGKSTAYPNYFYRL